MAMNVVSVQSPEQLKKMIVVIVVVCAAFGLTVSEAKTVVVVVCYIQRIGCQPGKTTLHDGQSRSWSANQGKNKNKNKSPSAPPPPPPLTLLVRRK